MTTDTMNTNERVTAALAAWRKCPDASLWPSEIDTLLVATWQGMEIGWPRFEGEAFSIYRIADSSVVEEEELDSGTAQRLDWQVFKISTH